jgi:hypothetical protein
LHGCLHFHVAFACACLESEMIGALSHWFAREIPDVLVLDLELDDPRVQTFLRVEAIASEGVVGWIVVRVLGLGLAWGKCVCSTIYNYYPKHLRDARLNFMD